MSLSVFLNDRWQARALALIGTLALTVGWAGKHNAVRAEAEQSVSDNGQSGGTAATAYDPPTAARKTPAPTYEDLEKAEKKRLKLQKQEAKAQSKATKKLAKQVEKEASHAEKVASDQGANQDKKLAENSKQGNKLAAESKPDKSTTSDTAATLEKSDTTATVEKSDTKSGEQPLTSSAVRPDQALIAVLKDMTEDLKAAEAAKDIVDPGQRMVFDLVQEIINKAIQETKSCTLSTTKLDNGMTVSELQEAYKKALKELELRSQSEMERLNKSVVSKSFVMPSRKPEQFPSDENSPTENSQLRTTPMPVSVRVPSDEAFLVAPERALAGQTITISVMDSKHRGEAFVELSLNGKTAITDSNGQHTFTIAEDAVPGHSLNVTLAAHPENSPTTVEIFQPLAVAAEKQAPKIDKVTAVQSHINTIVVDGHNFDGMAGNVRATVDGQLPGHILAASPVQLRIALPNHLLAGDHQLDVTSQGLPSNTITFQTLGVSSTPAMASKKQLKKLARSDHQSKRRTLTF